MIDHMTHYDLPLLWYYIDQVACQGQGRHYSPPLLRMQAVLQTILNQMIFQDHEVDGCQLQLIQVMIRIALLQGVILIEDQSMLLCWSSHINHKQPAYQERYSKKGKLEAETEVFKRVGIANLIGWSIAHQETQLIVLHIALHTVNVKLAVQIQLRCIGTHRYRCK